MKIEIDNVKGFQDFLPPESLKREAVRKIAQKYFKLFGFVPFETPMVEFEELIRSEMPLQDEDEAVSDRFKLKDKGGRNLMLRYEFTFQLPRILRQNPTMKLPIRRYQIGENFRDEPIGPGRFRQFTQCDIDIIGDSSANADIEILATMNELLKELKIQAEFQVNNKKLLNAIIESCQINDVKGVMRELDKMEKVGEDTVKMNLRKFADTNQIMTLFKLMEKDLKFFQENAFDGAKELTNLFEKAKLYGVTLKFNPFLARGLGYYTGNIFEIKQPGKATIAGGGRYDKVVGKFLEREIPAVGLGFGLERITELAQIETEPQPKLLIISLDQEEESIELAKKLRKAEVSTLVSLEKAGKALEYANALAIPYVIFLGEQEIIQKKFKLKNMKSGDEKLLTEKQLVKGLSK